MIGPTRYYSNLPRRPRARPSDGLPAAGVLADPLVPKSIIGIAYPYAYVGGSRAGDDPVSPPEVLWRLVIDRSWEGSKASSLVNKEVLEGRFVLRDGEFVELAEDLI